MTRARRIGLIGCVKKKRAEKSRAKDLYTSPLFHGRRRFVESSCDSWFILSAKHGLVSPEKPLAPYDETLNNCSAAQRQKWSQQVLRALEVKLGDLAGIAFEIHAGANYRDFGLVAGLEARGASVDVPAMGLRLGRQLQFYAMANSSGGNRHSDLQRFYGLMAELEKRCGGTRLLAKCDGRMDWPQRGVYFFFEPGELRSDEKTPRVVRVGTHALRPSKTTLWRRLRQHKGNTGGSQPGGGNHRGSIFRLHIGEALLNRGEYPNTIRNSWARGNTRSKATSKKEYPLERAVSDYISAMPFLWLDVPDAPSRDSNRGKIEVGSIALLSNLDKDPIDKPSKRWLGRKANRDVIRGSGLWNVNHVAETDAPPFLDILAHYVRA